MASVFHRVPPLHLLIAFEAAARLGSFARAAEELSVTPSAVSHRIKNLEELWGDDLFVRFNNGALWKYSGVSEQVYNDMRGAPSIGKFFNAHIRSKHPEQKVSG